MLGEEGFLLGTPETKRILRASVFGDHDDLFLRDCGTSLSC